MKLILPVVTVFCCFYSTYGINRGETASRSKFNYVVSIEVTKRTAHCLTKIKGNRYRFENRKVTVYAYNDNTYEPSTNAIKRSGKKAYFINEFFRIGIDDIAILELNEGLNLTADNTNILRKLTLPSLARPQDSKVGQYKSYDNVRCVIAGYGEDIRDEYNNGALKKMYSQILPCSQNRRDVNKYLLGNAITRNGCYPIDPLGICKGDSGAPVVLLILPPTIIGVVASTDSKQCDSREEDTPEVYMRVTNYVDFIERVTLSKPERQNYRSHDFS